MRLKTIQILLQKQNESNEFIEMDFREGKVGLMETTISLLKEGMCQIVTAKVHKMKFSLTICPRNFKTTFRFIRRPWKAGKSLVSSAQNDFLRVLTDIRSSEKLWAKYIPSFSVNKVNYWPV